MSTSVYPYLPPDELLVAEEESLARELSWLLDSLQETLESLKSGLEECYALLAPIEPGSTLVLSSHKSESIKGHVTRVGTGIVKGQIHIRLKTHPPLTLSLSPTTTTEALTLPALTTLRSLLNQSLDCIDITRWTGDRHSAPFISSQLHLLHSLLLEALAILKGPITSTHPSGTPIPNLNSTQVSKPELPPPPEPLWCEVPPSTNAFSPTLPENLSLHLSLTSPTLHLTLRVLESTTTQQDLASRFAFAIGAQRRLEHDEMDDVFSWRDEEVRVKEKVRVESSADPSLLSLGVKLGALERAVEAARGSLSCVMGVARDG